MRYEHLFSLMFVALSSNAIANPSFEAFPVPVFPQTETVVSVRLTTKVDRRYASALRAAVGQRANFAGRHVLVTWGCGTSCVMGAAVAVKTGEVAWIPFTVSNWNEQISEPIEYRADSRLLVVHGSMNEKGAGNQISYWIFDGRTFATLRAKGSSH
jgi:hypothetical protein